MDTLRNKIIAVVLISAMLIPAMPMRMTAADEEVDFPENVKEAINRALHYLARTQQKDGSWVHSGKKCTGIVALALMAFMAQGSTPGQGPYGEQVARGLDWMLKQCHPNGLIAKDVVGSGPMYSQGLATLFLAEAWGMTMRDDVHDKLRNSLLI